ncbi:MAG: hypothetical protein IPH69_03740 [Bacteroidales bacterium]|nr:hypothetical protein [Bacteroidales bacterium]
MILTTTGSGAPGWLTLATLPSTSGILQIGNGGTGTNTVPVQGGVIYGSSATAYGTTAAGSAGQVLQSNGTGAPVWSTPTYPGLSGSAGQILRSNGTNNIYSTSTFADTYAASSILYSSGANNVTGLTTGNDGVLVTDAGGVPSISSTLPDAVQYNITKLGTITNGTWNGSILGLAYGGTNTDLSSGSAVGDLLTGTATGFTRLADVATGNVLISGGAGAPPTYGKVGLTTHVSGVLQALNGGTGYDNTYTNGQLLIGNSSGTLTRNPLTGTANQVIVTNGSGSITLPRHRIYTREQHLNL